jgi:DNA-binding SARP family transcriptional activator
VDGKLGSASPGIENQKISGQVRAVAAKVRVPTPDSYGVARLDALMERLWRRRLGLVVGPAGSGKTTVLARFASTSGAPVAWYRCESWDVSQDHLLRHLESAFAGLVGDAAFSWRTVEEASSALEQWSGARMILVIDDAHTIAGTPAEAALERFIDYAPASLLTLVASRAQPGFNLSRLRVSGALGEINGEDLRFRSWEVESLFRDYYREPLPPVELAELARRTEGWAAGLQLFHLATSGKASAERLRILRALGGGSRLVREYLARNVLDELPKSLRRFLIDSCVLGRLSGPICNRFLNRTDSHHVLQELERRQIFTSALGNDGDYRYHEVLRSHLEHVLVEETGEAALRTRYRQAGVVLEEAGAVSEALHAYCRAEDWTAIDRLLGRNGAQLAQGTGVWIDALPPAVLAHDPWLILASARRHRAEGRWRTAVETYQLAEKNFGGSEAILVCQRERQTLAAWLTAAPAPPIDSLGLLRLATSRDPLGVRAQLAGHASAQERLVAGLASLLAGDVIDAKRLLLLTAEGPDSSEVIAAGARLAAAVGSLLGGDLEGMRVLEEAVEHADALGQGFMARLGRACTALEGQPRGADEAAAVRSASARVGDHWGAAAAALFQGWNVVVRRNATTDAVPILESATEEFHELGAAVLEAWATALLALALAQTGHPRALEAARKSENLVNSSGADGARLFVYHALALAEPQRTAQYVALAQAARARTGLSTRLPLEDGDRADRLSIRAVAIRCFGEFRISVDGHPLRMRTMKPRTRALLRRLSADAGIAIHREVLQEALWPGADPEASARNLHVAISSLRQALEPGVARGASSLVVREGDAYRLVLPQGSEVDLVLFDEALKESRMACAAGGFQIAVQSIETAFELAQNQLLPEEGSADWIVLRRERCRTALLAAAQQVGVLLMQQAQPSTAARICMAGLAIDRYDDALWRLVITARQQAGDMVAASRAESDYRQMLTELGVTSTAT